MDNTAMLEKLNILMASVQPLDESAMAAARERQARLAKPPGSLGKLEELSVQLSGISGKCFNWIETMEILVFAADNGVVAEGISSAPQSVTLQQTVNIAKGITGVGVLAKCFGCKLTVCDVGVNGYIDNPSVINHKIAYGTGNIVKGPAMTRSQTLEAMLAGAELAMNSQADVLGIGEMGIGNTTTSSAILSVLLGIEAEIVTGRGGGLNDESFARKKTVIKSAIELNRPDKENVIDVLSKLGGFDIAAMCGALIAAAAAKKPVVIDGFISAVAALCAVRLCPAVRCYLIPSHASKEPGYALAMEALGLKPMLLLDMRLGEGSGCPLAFQLLKAAYAVMNNMASFDEAGIDDSYLKNIRGMSF